MKGMFCAKFVVKHFHSSVVRQFSLQQINRTNVLRHVFLPERTPDGMPQRNPAEKQEFQKYELIGGEDEKPVEPLKVILLEDIEGIGLTFDVVEVDRDLARHNLIPLKKVAYASPFNLVYYAEKNKRMREELAKKVRIPYNYLKLGRSLMEKVVPILVSMTNPWSIDKTVILTSLLASGIEASPSAIHCQSNISGPNLGLEAYLLRFYLVVDRQYVIPMLGRITHVSSDSENLYPEHSNLPSKEHLQKYNLRLETPHYFVQSIDDDFNVLEFMTAKND